jgi:hypothetical protein
LFQPVKKEIKSGVRVPRCLPAIPLPALLLKLQGVLTNDVLKFGVNLIFFQTKVKDKIFYRY